MKTVLIVLPILFLWPVHQHKTICADVNPAMPSKEKVSLFENKTSNLIKSVIVIYRPELDRKPYIAYLMQHLL